MDAMPAMPDEHVIRDEATLAALYGEPSGGAVAKEVDYIHPHYAAMIAASPFMVLATSGPDGLDTSPRGDPAGFVHILDDHTLLIPDRRGNNRIDSLRNIVENPAVALLFLAPGADQTLRVNGRAEITVDPGLIERLSFAGKPPKSVLRIAIDEVFVQCPRALLRAGLWNPANFAGADTVPSMGRLLEAATEGRVNGARYDAEEAPRTRQVLY